MCVNSDGVCVEERKMERDQRQGEKDSEREGDTESQRERKVTDMSDFSEQSLV